MNANPASIAACIVTGDGKVAPEIITWFNHVGIPCGNIVAKVWCDRSLEVAKNAALYATIARAQAARLDWCLFVDSDVRPVCGLSDQLLQAPYDLTCLRCLTPKGDLSWGGVEAFHVQMWLARTEHLARFPRPVFRYQYSPDMDRILGCTCQGVRQAACALGLTTGHVGWCDHTPSRVPVLQSF